MGIRFDLVDLQLFLHVVEGGSITAGAERAHLALASASARVQGMEDSLGTALLTRSRRGVAPTPAGLALAQHARAMMLQSERMRADLDQFAQGLRGRVRLLCNTAAMQEYLPDALGAFLVAHPQVHIDAQERGGDAIVTAVNEGSADLGIVSNEINLYDLKAFPFCRDQLALVVPPGHPLAIIGRQRSVTIWDAEGYGIVALTAGSALQEQWERHAHRRGRLLDFRVRTPSFEAQCRLVAAGAGISLMPETSARRLARAHAVEVLPATGLEMTRELRLCVRSLDGLPVHARGLVEHLIAWGETPR